MQTDTKGKKETYEGALSHQGTCALIRATCLNRGSALKATANGESNKMRGVSV